MRAVLVPQFLSHHHLKFRFLYQYAPSVWVWKDVLCPLRHLGFHSKGHIVFFKKPFYLPFLHFTLLYHTLFLSKTKCVCYVTKRKCLKEEEPSSSWSLHDFSYKSNPLDFIPSFFTPLSWYVLVFGLSAFSHFALWWWFSHHLPFFLSPPLFSVVLFPSGESHHRLAIVLFLMRFLSEVMIQVVSFVGSLWIWRWARNRLLRSSDFHPRLMSYINGWTNKC